MLEVPSFSFEKLVIYPTLLMVREKTINKVIGYVHKHPFEGGWFWFIDATTSKFFNEQDDAITDLIQNFTTVRIEKMAKKLPNVIINR